MPAWEREFAKWAPNMNTIMYIGDMKSRQTIQENEWTMPSGRLKFNAVVTSYEIILKDMVSAINLTFFGFSLPSNLHLPSFQLVNVLLHKVLI